MRTEPAPRAVLAAVAALWLAAPGPLPGQEAEELDRGTFELRVEGRRIGTERFAVRREGRDVQAVAEIQTDTATAVMQPMDVGMRTDESFHPELFRARLAGGEVQSVVAVREDGRLRVQVTSREGDRWKEFLAPEDLSVLDPRVAHQWYLVLRQHRTALDGSGRVRGPAVTPLSRAQIELRLERRGTERVDLPGARRSAVRYTATLADGEEAHIWTDEEGKVMKLTLPGRGWTAVRLPGATR